MRLISWNVNGLRAVLKKGFAEFVAAQNPDALCVQEIKAMPEQVELDVPGYEAHWHPAEKKGYAGTLTLTKATPLSVTRGLPGIRLGRGAAPRDTEGRVLTMEFNDLFLVNCYTPNTQRDLARLDFRADEWDPAFLKHCKRLEKTKPVVFCGDLNVAHREIDLANPKANAGSAGFTDRERAGFDRILEAGFIDTLRALHPDREGAYTWWAYFAKGARERNIGWRIDYFCISPALRPRLQRADILADILGSDHAPVILELA